MRSVDRALGAATCCACICGGCLLACASAPADGTPGFAASQGSGRTPDEAPGRQGSATAPAIERFVPGSADFAGDADLERERELTAENACGGSVFEPQQLPLDMYFLVDSSQSMAEPTASGQDKWRLVSGALINFLAQAQSAQIGAGIGYFPQGVEPACSPGAPGCLCIPVINLCLNSLGGSCLPEDYASPAVPLVLPPAPARVISDLQTRAFAGGTPTRAALEGTYRYLETWAAQNPGRKIVAVLATDGEPTGCDNNTAADVAALAASALAGPSRIQTFVIGVGRSLANLNQVALAGGTTRAFLTDTSQDLSAELGAALEAIRTLAGPCELELPEATPEGPVDPSLVNVLYTAPGSAAASLIAKTSSGGADGCGPEGGWYFGDARRKQIRLCEASCQSASSSRLELQFGCKTIVRLR